MGIGLIGGIRLVLCCRILYYLVSLFGQIVSFSGVVYDTNYTPLKMCILL